MTLARVVVRSTSGGEALVEPLDHGCGRCHEPGGCGGARLSCAQPRLFAAENGIGAAVGEEVEVSVAPRRLAFVATCSYVLPLLGLLAGAVVGGDGLSAIIGAVLGAGGGYLAGRRLLLAENLKLPVIVRRCL